MWKQWVCVVLLGLLLPLSWTEQLNSELVIEIDEDYPLPRSRRSFEEDPILIYSTEIQRQGLESIVEIENLASHHVIVKRSPIFHTITAMMVDDVTYEAEIMLPVGHSRNKRDAEEITIVLGTSEYHLRVKRATMADIPIVLDVVPSRERRSLNQMVDVTSIEAILEVEYTESGHSLQSYDGNTRTRRDANIILHRSKRGEHTRHH